MSARGDLTGVIYKARWVDGIRDTTLASDGAVADAILAAGYRKPRTISTAEELDALPYESVVKASDGNVWESLVGGWFETGSRVSTESSSIRLPATVLYEPEAP